MSPDSATHPEFLSRLRERIDRIDRQLIEVLNRRASLVTEAFAHKRSRGEALYDGRRVQEMLSGILERNEGPLTRVDAERLVSFVLDFFGLEYAPVGPASRGRVHVPLPLRRVPRPWIVADLAEAGGESRQPRSLHATLERSGVRLVRADRARGGPGHGLLRIGFDAEADILESRPGEALPRARAKVALFSRHPAQGTLGGWLRGAHDAARQAEVESLLLLVPPEATEELGRLLDRTHLPVLVDGRGDRGDAALESAGRGADGVLLSFDPSAPAGFAEAATHARLAPAGRRRPSR